LISQVEFIEISAPEAAWQLANNSVHKINISGLAYFHVIWWRSVFNQAISWKLRLFCGQRGDRYATVNPCTTHIFVLSLPNCITATSSTARADSSSRRLLSRPPFPHIPKD